MNILYALLFIFGLIILGLFGAFIAELIIYFQRKRNVQNTPELTWQAKAAIEIQKECHIEHIGSLYIETIINKHYNNRNDD